MLSHLRASTEALNHFLHFVANLNYADDGLKELSFFLWQKIEESLNDQSLQNIAA